MNFIIEILVIAIVVVVILVLASPNMRGRGYRDNRGKIAYDLKRHTDTDESIAREEIKHRGRM